LDRIKNAIRRERRGIRGGGWARREKRLWARGETGDKGKVQRSVIDVVGKSNLIINGRRGNKEKFIPGHRRKGDRPKRTLYRFTKMVQGKKQKKKEKIPGNVEGSMAGEKGGRTVFEQ